MFQIPTDELRALRAFKVDGARRTVTAQVAVVPLCDDITSVTVFSRPGPTVYEPLAEPEDTATDSTVTVGCAG